MQYNHQLPDNSPEIIEISNDETENETITPNTDNNFNVRHDNLQLLKNNQEAKPKKYDSKSPDNNIVIMELQNNPQKRR